MYFQMCNDFLAGNELRSSQRYHALDETAVFGSACRHEFPHLFINLKHGERLVYSSESLLSCTRITSINLDCVMLNGFYKRSFSVIRRDCSFVWCMIACNFVKYLRSSPCGLCLPDSVSFAIPSFHAYGHKAECQVCKCMVTCECLRVEFEIV